MKRIAAGLPIPDVPDQRLSTVHNVTSFEMFQCMKMGVGRAYYDTVVIKGTFDLAPGRLQRGKVQAAVALVDEYWDLSTPELSSVQHAGEAVLFKPSTDVIVTGSARSPHQEPRPSWYAAVKVERERGTVLDYTLQVTGPRRWRHQRLRGWTLSDATPATEVPIRYELAYGGAYLDRSAQPAEWIVYQPNPSGRGFVDEPSLDREASYDAPQWQAPDQPVAHLNSDLPLTGLGPVMRPWSARQQYAGSCDNAWISAMRADIARGLPADYPSDFDARFFQCAHPSLISREYLHGDETIHLLGLFHEHPGMQIQLPRQRVRAWLEDASGTWKEYFLPLDTVHIDLDEECVYLSWRLTLPHHREIHTAVLSTLEDR